LKVVFCSMVLFMCDQNVLVTAHKQLCKTLPCSEPILLVPHCILCTQVWSVLACCYRGHAEGHPGERRWERNHTPSSCCMELEKAKWVVTRQNRTLMYGHQRFIILIAAIVWILWFGVKIVHLVARTGRGTETETASKRAKPVGCVQGFVQVMSWETALLKWPIETALLKWPIEKTYLKFEFWTC
jgi:hypothetical protein